LTSVTVIPVMPIGVSACRTSSSLNGLMMATMSFMAVVSSRPDGDRRPPPGPCPRVRVQNLCQRLNNEHIESPLACHVPAPPLRVGHNLVILY
jgi:hypothetical protein